MNDAKIAISGADAHPHAADLLRAAYGAANVVLGAADDVGLRITLATDPDLVEGGFSIAATATDGLPPQITISGGPFSGVIYGVGELLRRCPDHPDPAVLGPAPISDAPALGYRTFWTWDHSTNWELSQIGQQEIGVFNPYQKPPDGFLADYRRVIDYCCDNRIAAVVIYGFLRDSHGGIEAAHALCRYANARGVRIIPGIAIGAYGGVYWEGNHRYNLSTWLKENPQFSAQMDQGIGFQLADLAFPLNFPRSDYTMTACPSAPETMDWMEAAVAWLAETFDIGGINIESGDYGVCNCARCVARRDNPAEAARREGTHGDSWSHTDMAANFPRLYRAATAKKSDLWIYCEMQWDNLLDPVAGAAQAALPDGAIYQYTVNRSFWRRVEAELTADKVSALPTHPNVLRCQFACQWNGDARSERYALNARDFADLAHKCDAVGMQGLTIWGEPSPYQATVELSYLAFSRLCWNPKLSWEDFMAHDVAPLLGGAAAAQTFVDIATELDQNATLAPGRLSAMQQTARGMCESSSNDAARRWLTLADKIARRAYMGS